MYLNLWERAVGELRLSLPAVPRCTAHHRRSLLLRLMDSDGERLKERREPAASQCAPSHQRDRPYCWSSRLGFNTPGPVAGGNALALA
jgi:hypothetical protein